MPKSKKSANRKYKDSVFRSLFNNKTRLLELYNAIKGTNYQDESIIEINTLEDVLFSDMKNDISFTVNKKMVVLIEHQSTINENMPLRLLSYIARVYEKLVDEDILQEKLRKIPRPEFIVLYNGTDPFPEKKYFKLSDAFEEIDESEKAEYLDLISLDLIVTVYNINKGCNPDLERKSKSLSGYAIFVAKVREHLDYYREYKEKEKNLKKAIRLAIDYCIERGILVDYFKKHSSEIASMTFLEYDLKTHIKVARREAREEGRAEGFEQGEERIQNYVLELIEQGLSSEEIKKKIEKTSKNKRKL